MSVRRALLLVCLAAVAALAGASAAAAGPDLSSAVAMGDSYASGEGAGPPFDPGTNVPRNRCHRSPLAWPRLLGVPAGRQVACSGATIANLTTGSAALAPDDVGQLSRLAGLPGATHVLVTLGGNDVGFADLVARCVIASCVAAAQARTAALPSLGASLTAAYRAIAATAPGARVIVVDYPEIIPSTPPKGLRCLWLADREVPALLAFLRGLDATIASAAQAAGVEHVATGDPFDGHELCTSSSWVFPIVFSLSNTQQAHPRPAGQAALAARVSAYLDANPVPPAP